MKKILACLFFIFLITPTFGENWIYFKSGAVEAAINEMVRADLRLVTATEYQINMDDNGRISTLGFYKVCARGGFDVKTPNGYDKCQKLLKRCITESGIGNKCIDENDGVITEIIQGGQRVKQCVGRDGSPLNYKNACTDSNAGGTCVKAFKNVNAQYRVAKGVVTELYSQITCKNRKIMDKTNDKYMYCSSNGKPYTFEFKGIKVQGDAFDEKLSVAEMLCRIGNANYGAVYASYDDQSAGKFGGVCRRDNDPQKTITLGDFIKAGTPECKKMSGWANRFGAYTVGTAANNVINVADGGGSAKPMRNLCIISGGNITQSSLTNELAKFGINNQSFMAVTFDNEDHAVEKITEYIKQNIPDAKNIECNLLTSRTTTQTNALGLASKTADVMTCTVDGKKVDFQFKSLRETGNRHLKAGMEGLECISQDGVYDGRKCRLLGEQECKTVIENLNKNCPTCKAPKWNGKHCVLTTSRNLSNEAIAKDVAVLGAKIGVGVALMFIPGGQVGAVGTVLAVAGDVAFMVGATAELVSQTYMDVGLYSNYIGKAEKCFFLMGDAQVKCAEDFISEYGQAVQSYEKDMRPEQAAAIDEVLSRLFEKIPNDSDFWLHFVQDSDVFDPVNCVFKYKTQPWQYIRQWGRGLQLMGGMLKMLSGFQYLKTKNLIERKLDSIIRKTGTKGPGRSQSTFGVDKVVISKSKNSAGSTSNIQYLRARGEAATTTGEVIRHTDQIALNEALKPFNLTAEDLANARGIIDTSNEYKIILANGKQVDAIKRGKIVINNVLTDVTVDAGSALRGLAAGGLAANRAAGEYTRTTSSGLRVPVCLDNKQNDNFTPENIKVIIEEDEVDTRPDRIVGQPCAEKDLPANATSGVYTDKGIAKWDCWNEKKQAVVKCSCAARECKDPYIIATNSAGTKLGTCVKQNGQDSLQQCLTERAGNREGTACCYLKASVAKWDGAHCVCTDKNKDFSIVNGAGVCKLTPVGACVASGGHWGTRSGREECQCGTNQEYSNGIWRDRGLKLKTDEFPTGTCACLDGYQWKNSKDKSQGCKPM